MATNGKRRAQLLRQTMTNYHQHNYEEALGQQFNAEVRGLLGCRVGAVYLRPLVSEADALFRALSKGGCAAARQIFAWPFQRVAVYWEGNEIRMEADWPEDLAITNVPLGDVALYPHTESKQRGDVWFPGINEYGELVGMWLDDVSCPHILIGGTTGSGKSVAMHSIAIQVARNYPRTRLVLMDAKDGDGLSPIGHLRGQVAPLSVTLPQIKAALAWLVDTVKARQAQSPRAYAELPAYKESLSPVYAFVDEIQEIAMSDREVAEAVRLVTAKGRSVKVHLLLGTQKPLQKVFGDNLTKGNIPGRLALHAMNYKDSEILVGGEEPRADYLWPYEAWVIHPAARHCRVQLFSVAGRELADAPAGPPEMEEWPDLALHEAAGTLDSMKDEPCGEPDRSAAALAAVSMGYGRDRFRHLLKEWSVPTFGNDKMGALLCWARAVLGKLQEHDHIVQKG